MYFHSSLQYISASVVNSAHTHVTDSFGSVMYVGLRGEGRRNWEGWNEYESYDCIEITLIKFS